MLKDGPRFESGYKSLKGATFVILCHAGANGINIIDSGCSRNSQKDKAAGGREQSISINDEGW